MTRAEAIRQALLNLTIIDPREQAAPEDAATVGAHHDQERARLKERGLVWWNEDSIPNSVAGAFCELIAAAAAASFGKAYNPGNAEARIASVKSSAEIPPVRAIYF